MNEMKKRRAFPRFCELLLVLFCMAILVLSTSSAYAESWIDTYRYPREFREYVEEASERFSIEPNMIYAIIKAESGFCATAVSRMGAIGLMQIIPDTYLFDIRDRIGLDEPSAILFSPRENILSGTYYFSRWYTHFGSAVEALASYNAGIGNVQKWLADESISDMNGLDIEKIPFEETRNYVKRVLRYKAKYDALYGEKTFSREAIREEECYAWAQAYGAAYRIDPRFVMAIVKTESSFVPNIVSLSGAVGMMQIMQDTYEVDIKANLKLEEPFETLLCDAEFNVKCGTYYLHWLDERLDGYEQIAAAYNGGIGNVRKWLSDSKYSNDGKTLLLDRIPLDQTRRYVRKVMTYYKEYCARYPQ